MKVGIIGIGVVGGAVLKSFQLNNIDTVAYDKFKNIGSLDDILDTEMVFLCLPTLFNHDINTYDKTAIYEVCDLLADKKYHGLVVIKSTVEPTTSQNIANKYNLFIFHNPEFLTARTAFEDFHEQKHIIIGRTSQIDNLKSEKINQFFRTYYPDALITICNSTESESIKIFCNCFYAVKVQFFNELYLLCKKMNANYDVIKNTMLKNNWINPMHTNVPGPDGKLSYGGMCFPKDTNALLSFMKLNNTPHQILEATVNERNAIRND